MGDIGIQEQEAKETRCKTRKERTQKIKGQGEGKEGLWTDGNLGLGREQNRTISR